MFGFFLYEYFFSFVMRGKQVDVFNGDPLVRAATMRHDVKLGGLIIMPLLVLFY